MPTTPNFAVPYPSAGSPDNVPYDLQLLAERIDALLTPTWTALTLQNAWVGANSPSYTKVAGRIVQLSGEVHTGATATVAFTLPAGFRPKDRLTFKLPRPGTGTTAGVIIIEPTGVATIYASEGTIPTGSPGFPLGAVMFVANN